MPWDHDFDSVGTHNDPVEYTSPPPAVEMLRLNTGKPRLSLVPTAFTLLVVPHTKLIYDVAAVMEYGATKYSMNNWRKAGPWLKVMDSGLRHLYKMLYTGEKVDEESGISHAGHLGCNLAFLLEFIREGDGLDDRFTTKARLASSNTGGLVSVHDMLLDWRDGGPHSSLEAATKTLAFWLEKENTK